MIAAVVLAAGLSTRMGRQKLLLPLGGQPVVRWSVEGVLPYAQDVVVVTGRDSAAVREALAGLPVRFVENPSPESGQSSSIAVGVGALAPATRAVLIVLGDQPRTPRSVVPALIGARDRTGKAVVVPVYRGVRGTPVLFGAEVFAELRALHGDAGARSLVTARPERVTAVEIDSPMPVDVDTPEDLARVHVE
jgi:molybdenum cofactor cytidylyltransferase